MTLKHIFSARRISLYIMVVPENTFLWQAVKIMAKKSTSKHLLNSHKSPLLPLFNRAVISQSMILK